MIMTAEEFKALYVKNGKILPNTVTEISSNLYLSHNNISIIENLPSTINGTLWLNNNISVIENLPTNTISGALYLSFNKISVIQNLPNTIHSYLDLSHNNITTINSLPTNINGFLFLHNNPIFKQFQNQSKYTDVKDWAYSILMKKKLDAWSNL